MSDANASTPVAGAEELRRLLAEREPTHVQVALADLDGVLRGKHVSREKLSSSLEKGLAFCDVVLGWDSDDRVYDDAAFTGWHTGFPDAPVRLLPETCREVPFGDGGLLVLGEFAEHREALCPRGALRRVLERAGGMGFTTAAGFEYEFSLFDETPHSVRQKGYRELRPITPEHNGYSLLRTAVSAELHESILALCRRMRIPLEALHAESGAGMLEAAIAVDEGLEAADKAVLFKTFVKAHVRRRGLMATFMSRWSANWPGQGGHIHVSLVGGDGRPAFHDAGAEGRMSATMRHFVAGQQALMPELLALVAPTVNAYSRLAPGQWAPTNATWGIENRTCALRVVPGSPSSQRVEYRVAGADANPYLALAAAVGSGLWGIEHELEPSAPTEGNAYEVDDEARRLPATLGEAAARLRASAAARELFGDAFVDHFATSRAWEERASRGHVTDWQLARYFEVI
jgi:glutamine synthetase